MEQVVLIYESRVDQPGTNDIKLFVSVIYGGL